MFRGVGGSIGKGTRREGVGAGDKVMRKRARGGLGEGEEELRTVEHGGVLGSLVKSVEGRSEERDKRKRNSFITVEL